MDRQLFKNMKCLITGAASGMGRSLALRLGDLGAELYLTDIQEDKLNCTVEEIRSKGGQVRQHQHFDITDFEAVRRFADEVHQHAGSMDMVMNVAGIAIWGSVDRMQHEQWKRVIDVNLMGPIHVVETFIPPMIEARKGGRLVNVASAAALFGLPWHAAYCASKYGVRGMSDVLRHDLHRHGIRVHLVCPGAVNSPMVSNISIAGLDTGSEKFESQRRMFRKYATSTDDAAKAILEGIVNNEYYIFTSLDIKWAFWMQKHFSVISDRFWQVANDYFQDNIGK